MDFKIRGKQLQIDLRELPKDQVFLIVKTTRWVCQFLKDAGYTVNVKVKKVKELIEEK